jgi:hypothetical protein
LLKLQLVSKRGNQVCVVPPGGAARAAALTPKKRSQIAAKAAAKRWEEITKGAFSVLGEDLGTTACSALPSQPYLDAGAVGFPLLALALFDLV